MISYTLVADGPTDRALIPIINWVLGNIPAVSASGFTAQFADPRTLVRAAAGLEARILEALKLFPCDIAFVHRDAEGESLNNRRAEIEGAVRAPANKKIVPIIPVRMTEAWLLIDEFAIRHAADNPNGQVALDLPPIRQLEQLPDPKLLLNELLICASEKTGRRREQFKRPCDLAWRRVRVADLISDFASLRSLEAFTEFEDAARYTFRESMMRPKV